MWVCVILECEATLKRMQVRRGHIVYSTETGRAVQGHILESLVGTLLARMKSSQDSKVNIPLAVRCTRRCSVTHYCESLVQTLWVKPFCS